VPAVCGRNALAKFAANSNRCARLDEDASAYEQFLKDNHVDFPTYRDATKKIALDYGTRMYPETYLIDRQGKIARKIIGGQAWDEGDMLLYVQSLLIQK
jgi:peroxiredoxin